MISCFICYGKNDLVEKNELTWHNLLIGFAPKRKTPFDYYSCEYLCPEKEFASGSGAIPNLEDID